MKEVPVVARLALGFLGCLLAGFPACSSQEPDCPVFDASHLRDRESVTSMDRKLWPEDSRVPPRVNLGYRRFWHQPVLVDVGAVNTSGAEDSPFITPDGNTLYFFFTPDAHTNPIRQAKDRVSGIYASERVGGAWQPAERVFLFRTDSLEGCAFLLGDKLWVCAAVCGYPGGVQHFSTERVDGTWGVPELDDQGLNDPAQQIGELHIHPDGQTLYFHSTRSDGMGGQDIWMAEWADTAWGPPKLVEGINSQRNEGYPFLSQDGQELWFSGDSRARNPRPGPSLFRSSRNPDGSWAEPEEILSGFAAEPSLDAQGNIYFAHHYLDEDGPIIEADIYVAHRRGSPFP